MPTGTKWLMTLGLAMLNAKGGMKGGPGHRRVTTPAIHREATRANPALALRGRRAAALVAAPPLSLPMRPAFSSRMGAALPAPSLSLPMRPALTSHERRDSCLLLGDM